MGKSGGKGSSTCERLNNFDTYVPRADNKNRRNVESWTSKQGNKYSTAFCMKLQRAVSCIVQQTAYNRKIWRDKYLRGWPLKNLRVISEFPGVSVTKSFFFFIGPNLLFIFFVSSFLFLLSLLLSNNSIDWRYAGEFKFFQDHTLQPIWFPRYIWFFP